MELTTTIMIIAPHEVQALTAPLRRQYALDKMICVPAHITILYPFVPYEQLDAASEKLRQICAEIEPFDITVEGYGNFPRFIYMKPKNEVPIRNLCHRVFEAFPDYLPFRGVYGDTPTLHMTVGEFATEEERAAAIMPVYKPITFRAERVHVMYGVEKLALTWIAHSVIRLGEG